MGTSTDQFSIRKYYNAYSIQIYSNVYPLQKLFIYGYMVFNLLCIIIERLILAVEKVRNWPVVPVDWQKRLSAFRGEPDGQLLGVNDR